MQTPMKILQLFTYVWPTLVRHQSRSYNCSPMCGLPLSYTNQDPAVVHLCVARPCQTPIKILQLFTYVWPTLVRHQSRSYNCPPMYGPPLSDTNQDPTIVHLCVARPCQTPIKILQLFTYVWPALVRHQSRSYSSPMCGPPLSDTNQDPTIVHLCMARPCQTPIKILQLFTYVWPALVRHQSRSYNCSPMCGLPLSDTNQDPTVHLCVARPCQTPIKILQLFTYVWPTLVRHQSRSYNCPPMYGPPLSDTNQDPTIVHLCVARPCQTPIKILQLFTYVWPALSDTNQDPTIVHLCVARPCQICVHFVF